MKMKKLVCLLLALILASLCFAGCRGKKEEMPEPEPVQQAEEQTPEPEPEPEMEEEQEPKVEYVIIPPAGEQTVGMEEDTSEIELVIPEDAELGGD